MHYKIIATVGLALVIFSSCEKSDEENRVETGAHDPFTLVYLKGSAWTDYSNKAQLNQDGLLLMDVRIGITGAYHQWKRQISVDTLALIHEKIAEATKIKFRSNYGFGTDKPDDLPVTFIKYRMGIQSDSTVIYYPADNELPEELQSLKGLMEQVVSGKR